VSVILLPGTLIARVMGMTSTSAFNHAWLFWLIPVSADAHLKPPALGDDAIQVGASTRVDEAGPVKYVPRAHSGALAWTGSAPVPR